MLDSLHVKGEVAVQAVESGLGDLTTACGNLGHGKRALITYLGNISALHLAQRIRLSLMAVAYAGWSTPEAYGLYTDRNCP